MAYRVNGVDIHYQGINLNCGRYCLEALMRWKHGTRYGSDLLAPIAYSNANNRWEGQYDANPRDGHTVAVQTHIDTRFKTAFDVSTHKTDYGLVEFATPAAAADWETRLRTYGPIIASGRIGAVRAIPFGGHYVLVIGINSSDEVEYLDPLRPHHALGGGPTTMGVARFHELASAVAYAAAV